MMSQAGMKPESANSGCPWIGAQASRLLTGCTSLPQAGALYQLYLQIISLKVKSLCLRTFRFQCIGHLRQNLAQIQRKVLKGEKRKSIAFK
jgi:hypothetical protein